MFAAEYYHHRQHKKWTNYEMYGDYVVTLAYWMIHVHDVANKVTSTSFNHRLGSGGGYGYAYQGLIVAYEIAQSRNDPKVLSILETVIDRGLYDLTTWQVGGPLQTENDYLIVYPTKDPVAMGGILSFSGGSSSSSKKKKKEKEETTTARISILENTYRYYATTNTCRCYGIANYIQINNNKIMK